MDFTPGEAGRFSPIFFIRESKVVGFTPKSSAAPSPPLIVQSGFLKHDDEVFALAPLHLRFGQKPRPPGCPLRAAQSDVERGGESVTGRSKSSAPPREIITARSITFPQFPNVAGPVVAFKLAMPARVNRGFGQRSSFN